MKLTDFGLSAILSKDASFVEAKTRAPGNVGHMSPEVIMMQKFNEKADVYGFGVLIWEILKGYEVNLPFSGATIFSYRICMFLVGN
jgi:serine/threonine protein kinase